MTIFEVIRQDHDGISALFDQLERTSERAAKTRQHLTDQLCVEMEAHTVGEEQVFYPLLHHDRDTREMAIEADEEHHLIRLIVSELQRLSPTDSHFKAKVKVLRECVDMHVDQEESEMMPIADCLITPEEARELGGRMIEVKQQVKTMMMRLPRTA